MLTDDYALTREDPGSFGEQRFVALGMSATGALLVAGSRVPAPRWPDYADSEVAGICRSLTSDEELVPRWSENVVWQSFSGMDYHASPGCRAMTRRSGACAAPSAKKGLEQLLKASIETTVEIPLTQRGLVVLASSDQFAE